MRIAIFYATNTGYTEEVAEELQGMFGPGLIDVCQNVEDLKLEDLQGYDILIMGVATWDVGDLPYDWALLYDKLGDYDFSGTKIAMFGLGDQVGYPDTFLDAMGIVYRGFLERGAIGDFGFWPTKEYDFTGSLALYDNKFCGLAIDQDNEPEHTSERLEHWCSQIKRELDIIRLCD